LASAKRFIQDTLSGELAAASSADRDNSIITNKSFGDGCECLVADLLGLVGTAAAGAICGTARLHRANNTMPASPRPERDTAALNQGVHSFQRATTLEERRAKPPQASDRPLSRDFVA
jgi:hypothetical protein